MTETVVCRVLSQLENVLNSHEKSVKIKDEANQFYKGKI